MAPCSSCHAGCCRSFAVPVTGADIIRIERQLRLSFWDFVCRWADVDNRVAHGLVPHFFFPDMPETPFVICLLHSDSVFLPGTTKCRFLREGEPDADHPMGEARCGAYGVRPLACRVFPTKFNATGDLALLCDVPTTARSDPHPAYELCPREWELSDIDPVQAVQDLVLIKYEIAFFREVAAAWNRSPRPWTVFPDFLHLVYSHRVQRDSGEEAASRVAAAPRPGVRQTGSFQTGSRQTGSPENTALGASRLPFFPTSRLGPISQRAAA
jgi:hypothetical protein